MHFLMMMLNDLKNGSGKNNMHPLFTLFAWKAFFTRLIQVSYPTTVLLLIFSLNYIKKFKNNSQTRFFIIAFICLFGMRWAIYFGGTPFNNRYFLPALIPIIIFCSFGYRYLSIVSYKMFKKKFKRLKFKRYIIYFTAFFAIACIAKVWYPRKEKAYIKPAGYFIKEHAKGADKDIVVINNLSDKRFLYYANAKSASFSIKKLKQQIIEFKKQEKSIYLFIKNNRYKTEELNAECSLSFLKLFEYKYDKYQLYKID